MQVTEKFHLVFSALRELGVKMPGILGVNCGQVNRNQSNNFQYFVYIQVKTNNKYLSLGNAL